MNSKKGYTLTGVPITRTLNGAPATTTLTTAPSTLAGAPIASSLAGAFSTSTLAGAPSLSTLSVTPSSSAFTRAPSTSVTLLLTIGACTLLTGIVMLTIAIVLLRKRYSRMQQHSGIPLDSLPLHELPFSPSSPMSTSSSCPVLPESSQDEPIAMRTRARKQKVKRDMDDYSLVFTTLVNSYQNYVELENFASQYGLRDDPEVQARLQLLFDRDVPSTVSEIEDLNETIDVSKYNSEQEKKSTKRARFDIPSTSQQTVGAEANTSNSSSSVKPYFIDETHRRKFKTTLATDTSFKVKFNDQWQGEKLTDLSKQLYDMFEDLLSRARGHNADLGRVVVQHPNLSNPIIVPLQPWENLDADAVMDQIMNVLNSNEELDVDENMVVTVGSIDLPKGGAKKPITRLFGPGNSLKKNNQFFM